MTNPVWTHAAPHIFAAFLAAAVEFVEALTVILAVGTVRGWRFALFGAASALAALLLLVLMLGSALLNLPARALQMSIGALLLLFGLRWLRKAILRAAGIIPLHDEAAAFARETQAMLGHGPASGWDPIAFGAAFQITMLEGIEVVFIVVAIGAGGPGLLLPASLGAVVALLAVIAMGLLVHRPLSRIPENSLKFAVGVLLSAFGTFWFGEAIGVAWPGADLAVACLVAGFLAVAGLAVRLCRVLANWPVAQTGA